MLEAVFTKKLRDFTMDLSFQVRDGEILTLMGNNGSGKSTTLNIIAGLLSRIPDGIGSTAPHSANRCRGYAYLLTNAKSDMSSRMRPSFPTFPSVRTSRTACRPVGCPGRRFRSGSGR